jgi:hypothetical protein
MVMIKWPQQCTYLDLANLFCLLASNMYAQSPGHVVEAKHNGTYILFTMDLGLIFAFTSTATLDILIYFLIGEDFCYISY